MSTSTAPWAVWLSGLGVALFVACDADSATPSPSDTETDAATAIDEDAETGAGSSGDAAEDTGGTMPIPETTGGASPESSSCEDGAQNGDEEGIDCGGDCQRCAPPGWTCEQRFYDDGVCQCGCSELDVDCSSTAVAECAYVLCPTGEALIPGQSLNCAEVPEVPEAWECSNLSYGNSECDCGCGVLDFDCETDQVADCDNVHCPEHFTLDEANPTSCLPPPADAVLNPSFEEAPSGGGDVPGWEVLDDVGGIASVMVVGPGQTTAPEGSRALWLQSVNGDLVGARTVRSSAFFPPSGLCTVTVAVGDSNEDSEFTDFGQLRVRAPALPSPLDLVAEVEIDNRGNGGVSPPVEGYADAVLTFVADGESLYHVDIRVRGSFGTRSFHADDVRIVCDGS